MSSQTPPPSISDKLIVTTGIEELAPSLFAISGIYNAFGIHFPHRMLVIRLPCSQDLVVYSPFCPTMVDVSPLGTVKAVIAPSLMHDTYAQAFVSAHPGARLYSSPALPVKYPTLDWGTVLDESSAEDVISDQLLVRVLTKFEPVQEVVLFHVPTKSLIVADLAFNFTPSLLRRMEWKSRWCIKGIRATGRLGWSLPGKMVIRKGCKGLFGQLEVLMEKWDWDRFVMCHGEIVENGGKDAFRDGNYKWVRSVADGDGVMMWKGVAGVVAIAVVIAYVVRQTRIDA